MSDPEEKEERGFRVIDRRGGGEPDAEAPATESSPPDAEAPAAESAPPAAEAPGAESAPPAAEAPGAESAPPGLPQIDFPTFVLSLFTSALYEMGVAPPPAGGEPPPEPNLLLARQTIDTLEMLQTKTRGNLDDEEARLLENALYELHMRFVEASK